MASRDARLLSAGHNDRVEPLVTYRRLPPDDASSPAGRVEPHFTAVRVDRRGRVPSVDRDGIETLPLVEAPPSDGSIDPSAEMTSGEIRQVLRPRRSRLVALAGVFALLVGAGVLAATYGGIVKLDASPEPSALVSASGEESQAAVLESGAVEDSGRAVRVVAAYQVPSASETAALAPRAAADPVAGGAALSDQATVSGEAALLAEPPGRVIVDAPLPRLRPATASFHPPQAPTTGIEPDVGVATMAIGTAPAATTATVGLPPPAAGTDVDSALASVDRILDEQRAATAMVGSGDDEFYGPAAPAAVQPLPLPQMQPLQAAPAQPVYPADPYAQAYPAQPVYPAGPQYPAVQAYPEQPAYPVTQVPVGEVYGPYYPAETVAEAAPRQPWWLPKRRATTIDVAPVPPADIPGSTGGVW